MATDKRTIQRKLAIEGLAARYPKAFTTDPLLVRPLKVGIVEDILADLRTRGIARDVVQAVGFYQSTFAYLRAVLLVRRRRDLAGNRVEFVTDLERKAAKLELKRRDLWTPAIRAAFNRRDWIDD